MRAIEDAAPASTATTWRVYELYRSHGSTVSNDTPPVPGCIVIVDIGLVDADRERQRRRLT